MHKELEAASNDKNQLKDKLNECEKNLDACEKEIVLLMNDLSKAGNDNKKLKDDLAKVSTLMEEYKKATEKNEKLEQYEERINALIAHLKNSTAQSVQLSECVEKLARVTGDYTNATNTIVQLRENLTLIESARKKCDEDLENATEKTKHLEVQIEGLKQPLEIKPELSPLQQAFGCDRDTFQNKTIFDALIKQETGLNVDGCLSWARAKSYPEFRVIFAEHKHLTWLDASNYIEPTEAEFKRYQYDRAFGDAVFFELVRTLGDFKQIRNFTLEGKSERTLWIGGKKFDETIYELHKNPFLLHFNSAERYLGINSKKYDEIQAYYGLLNRLKFHQVYFLENQCMSLSSFIFIYDLILIIFKHYRRYINS